MLRTYDEKCDQHAVLELWRNTVGVSWVLPEAAFFNVLSRGNHFVEERDDHIVGFVGSYRAGWRESDLRSSGSIILLMVAPAYQRKGIGRTLLRSTLEHFAEHGVTQVVLGASGDGYFWPGVPANLPDAIRFFRACGWNFHEFSFDLMMTLDSFEAPLDLLRRLSEKQIEFTLAAECDAQQILQFEAVNFPDWHQYFESTAKHAMYTDILVARDAQSTILGSALISDMDSVWDQPGILWQQHFENSAGALGCLGVAEHARGKGIGLGLAAEATRLLKARGAKKSYLGWTWLVDWYGKLGYTVWRKYLMSKKILTY